MTTTKTKTLENDRKGEQHRTPPIVSPEAGRLHASRCS